MLRRSFEELKNWEKKIRRCGFLAIDIHYSGRGIDGLCWIYIEWMQYVSVAYWEANLGLDKVEISQSCLFRQKIGQFVQDVETSSKLCFQLFAILALPAYNHVAHKSL